jgi:hypothetical protein
VWEKVMLIVGRIIFFVFVICLFLNSLLMLISPKTWFKLPGWLGFHGGLSPKRYSSGSGSVEVRITGALGTGVIIGIFIDYLLG